MSPSPSLEHRVSLSLFLQPLFHGPIPVSLSLTKPLLNPSISLFPSLSRVLFLSLSANSVQVQRSTYSRETERASYHIFKVKISLSLSLSLCFLFVTHYVYYCGFCVWGFLVYGNLFVQLSSKFHLVEFDSRLVFTISLVQKF